MIKVIYSADKDPQKVMDFDKRILDNIDRYPHPILHFYDWKSPSITYGYFISPEKYLNLSYLNKRGIAIARRPTGGGVIFHLFDMAFSFIMPFSFKYCYKSSVDNYKFINTIVSKAYLKLLEMDECTLLIDEKVQKKDLLNGFCMARPTKYDVIIKNRKAIGAAERKTKKGVLHQGSISLFNLNEEIIENAIYSEKIKNNIYKNSFIPFPNVRLFDNDRQNKVAFAKIIKNKLRRFLIEEFEKNLSM